MPSCAYVSDAECQACARYQRQLLVLREAMRHSASETYAQEGRQLSSAAMARLKEALGASSAKNIIPLSSYTKQHNHDMSMR